MPRSHRRRKRVKGLSLVHNVSIGDTDGAHLIIGGCPMSEPPVDVGQIARKTRERKRETCPQFMKTSQAIGHAALLSMFDTPRYEMNTRLTNPSSHSTPPLPVTVGSRTQPFFVPSFSFMAFNLSRPNILPFGNTTGSSSM